MLYPTLNQPLVIVVMLAVGFASGLIFDIGRILSSILDGQKFSRHFFDFLSVLFSSFLLVKANLSVNYGQFRIYVFIVFLISLILERFLSKILWTKLLSKCYTSIENIKKKISGREKLWKKKKRNSKNG